MSRRLLLLIVLGACSNEVAGGKADGAAVFAEACARCHGSGGKPSESMAAQLGVKDLTSVEFGARATREHVEKQVRHGSDNKIMPSFAGALNDAQIAAVADYVLTLSKPK
jgi:mono/diheme cytochrome c family protein